MKIVISHRRKLILIYDREPSIYGKNDIVRYITTTYLLFSHSNLFKLLGSKPFEDYNGNKPHSHGSVVEISGNNFIIGWD